VHATELRDGVVAVLEEHPVEQLLGLVDLHALDARHGAGLELLGEFVEEQAAERLRRARVSREQRALHDLREVDEREHRTVEVREVMRESSAFLVRELLTDEPQAHVSLRRRCRRSGRSARARPRRTA
jgi:hypothetical protein